MSSELSAPSSWQNGRKRDDYGSVQLGRQVMVGKSISNFQAWRAPENIGIGREYR